jgi:ribonucleotide reductase beta subunit family protein with ferritin-like domain/intein/homing endonuclease
MTLLTPRATYAPFEYEQAYKYWELQQQSHWLHCVAKDQLVITSNGIYSVEELYNLGNKLTLFNNKNKISSSPMIKTAFRQLYKLHTKEGYTHSITLDHRVMTPNGWVEAGNLKKGDLICIQSNEGLFGNIDEPELAYLAGHYQGDGTTDNNNIIFQVWKDEWSQFIPKIEECINKVYHKKGLFNERYNISSFGKEQSNSGRMPYKRLVTSKFKNFNFQKNVIPDFVLKGNKKTVEAYLEGLFDADGTCFQNEKHESIKIGQADLKFMQHLQILLLNFGIKSSMYKKEARQTLLPDSKNNYKYYNCKDFFILEITNKNSVIKLDKVLNIFEKCGKKLRGFVNSKKSHPIENARFSHLEKLDEDYVYCVSVDTDDHAWICNGFITHNTEVQMSSDINDWKLNLTEAEKFLIGHILKGFTQSEVFIQEYWGQMVSNWFKKPEIQMMAATFSSFECFDNQTELLTSSGWKNVQDLTINDEIAQYNLNSKNISFVQPLKVVNYDYKGIMHHYYGQNIDMCVTPNHDLILINPHTRKVKKKKSEEGKWIGNYLSPVSGKGIGSKKELFPLEKLLIAIQADGSLRGLCPQSKDTWKTVDFKLKKANKIKYLKEILHNANIEYSEKKQENGFSVFTFALPKDINIKNIKNFGWVNTKEISYEWANSFIKELMYWDCNKRGENASYYNTNLEAIEKAQIISVLGGYKAQISINRTAEESMQLVLPQGKVPLKCKDCYVLNLKPTFETTLQNKEDINYDGKVYCVSVPEQNLISRRNGKVVFTGNTIHAVSYAYLNQSLGLEDFEAFMYEPTAKAKIDRLINTKGKSKEEIAKSLAVFSAFNEGVNLFSSFAILLNFSRFNKMKGLGQIIAFSIKDESLHSEAGCWLFRTLIKEFPELWTDSLKKELYDAARVTIDLEDDFISKAFSFGEVEGITEYDMKNFIRFRANTKLEDLGLKKNWKNIDKESLDRMAWFDYLSVGVAQADFFAQRVDSYAKGSVDFTKIWK